MKKIPSIEYGLIAALNTIAAIDAFNTIAGDLWPRQTSFNRISGTIPDGPYRRSLEINPDKC